MHEPMQERADNGDTAHASGCGLADNIDVCLARFTQLFYGGALQVLQQPAGKMRGMPASEPCRLVHAWSLVWVQACTAAASVLPMVGTASCWSMSDADGDSSERSWLMC